MTTNEGVLSPDLVSRSLLIHLVALGSLANRKSSLGAIKEQYLPEVQPKLEAELRGMIKKWKRTGKHLDNTARHRFLPWAQTIGGILLANDFTGFLDNMNVESVRAIHYASALPVYRFEQASAFFVTRSKKNLAYTRRARREVDKTTGLRSDQTIVLSGPKSSRLYPDPLRKIAFCDPDTSRRFVFLTNNFTLPALTIARLYKSRWQIE